MGRGARYTRLQTTHRPEDKQAVPLRGDVLTTPHQQMVDFTLGGNSKDIQGLFESLILSLFWNPFTKVGP